MCSSMTTPRQARTVWDFSPQAGVGAACGSRPARRRSPPRGRHSPAPGARRASRRRRRTTAERRGRCPARGGGLGVLRGGRPAGWNGRSSPAPSGPSTSVRRRDAAASRPRPLVVHPLVPHASGRRSARTRVSTTAARPGPDRTEVLRRPRVAQLHPLRISPIELRPHERGDVDAVDHDPAAALEVPRDVHVGDVAAGDPNAGERAVAEGRATEVGAAEGRSAEGIGRGVLGGHRVILPSLTRPAITDRFGLDTLR